MSQLRVKDNSSIQKGRFSDVAKLTSKIADKTLEQLEREGIFVFPELIRDTGDLTADQMILQSVNECFRTGNVMGFLGYGTERLTIGSRFAREGQDYFLQYLLDKVLEYPNVTDLSTHADSESRLFNLLLFLFPSYLKGAMRKGLYKKYVRCQYNDDNIKGNIEIARHIKRNTPFIGNIAYNQREFSYDNSLMELVRHTIEFIKKKPYGNNLLAKVKEEVKLVVEATPGYEPFERQRVIEANKRHAVRHAYYREYLALQRLCILILQYQKHQIGAGIRQIYGIVFDGAWLWEEYIGTLIADLFYHPMNKVGLEVQKLFEGNKGSIYPDFISKDFKRRIIADAKYKPIGNIGNRDYLQVLAYMFRFDAKTGYYLYPDAIGAEDEWLHLNSGTTYEKNVTPREDICIVKHGLRIPSDAESYEDFAEKMSKNELQFKQDFLSCAVDVSPL